MAYLSVTLFIIMWLLSGYIFTCFPNISVCVWIYTSLRTRPDGTDISVLMRLVSTSHCCVNWVGSDFRQRSETSLRWTCRGQALVSQVWGPFNSRHPRRWSCLLLFGLYCCAVGECLISQYRLRFYFISTIWWKPGKRSAAFFFCLAESWSDCRYSAMKAQFVHCACFFYIMHVYK